MRQAWARNSSPAPVVFDGDLGQEQAAPAAPGDHQAVLSDLDAFGIIDFYQGREDGDLVFQVFELGRRDRTEPRVFRRGVNGALDDGSVKRIDGFDEADASPQFALFLERDEGASLGQESSGSWSRSPGLSFPDIEFDGLPGEAQQLFLFVRGERESGLFPSKDGLRPRGS